MSTDALRFLRAGSIVLHYALDGPRDAPVFVFANSLGTDMRIWNAVAGRLAGRFQVVRYDKRGHGLSGATAPPYRMEDHVDDIGALLDALAIRQAIVCGISVGGMIALALAARQPERVRGLILCDTAAKIGTHEMWQARIDAILEGGIEVLADAIMERWLSPAFRAGRPDETAGWRNMLVRTPVDGYCGTCAAIRDADLTSQAAGIRVPTLALCGSEDGATPPDLVRTTAGLIPGARFELIDGAGHLPCIEYPERVARLIESFIEENSLA